MLLSQFQNADVAYMIGAFHSDGYFYTFMDKKRSKISHRFGISAKLKSLPMIESFSKIFNKTFERNSTIEYDSKREVHTFRAHINKLMKLFQELKILPKNDLPPQWISNNLELFGAYLAGLIDGDGNIIMKRPKYPQCLIRITSGTKSAKLADLIENLLNCSVNFERKERFTEIRGQKVHGISWDLYFYVSKKNIKYVKNFIYPYMQIVHKKMVLDQIFDIKKAFF